MKYLLPVQAAQVCILDCHGSFQKMADMKNSPIETAVIEFYREEIRQRYQLERLREVREFDVIPDEMLDALRDFFLERLYPPMEMRLRLDDAFEDLSKLLRSPGRLRPLVGAAITSMLRLSVHLPAIITTGIASLDALHETRQLERELMAVAETLRPEMEALQECKRSTKKYRDTMLKLIVGVPEATVYGLIDNVVRLFGALSDVKMLSGMLTLMEKCLKVMETKVEVYTDKDRESMALGLEVLRGGHDLFAQLKPRQFPKLLKGIETVELAWYKRVRAPLEKD